MTSQNNISAQLADFAISCKVEKLSETQIEFIQILLIDWLGCVCSGHSHPSLHALANTIDLVDNSSQCTCIPTKTKKSALNAALLNGCSSHIFEQDDFHAQAVIHPSAVIVPAVLAAAEMKGAEGNDFLVALAVGYEVFIRIAKAVGASHYYYYHNTATCGVFGAAVGAGKILGLTKQEMVWALGTAGTQSSGLWEFMNDNDNTMTKQFHPGNAARNGLFSALLAKNGFSGATAILEGQKGFYKATSSDAEPALVTEGLGEIWDFENTQLKFYPTCGHTHTMIEAAIKAVEQNREVKLHEIEELKVYTNASAINLLDGILPENSHKAKFSIPYCLGLAILNKKISTDMFTDKWLKHPEIQSFIPKVKIYEDPYFSEKYPERWDARVEFHFYTGEKLEYSCKYPKGHRKNPLSRNEIKNKFLQLSEGVWTTQQANAVCEKVSDLQNCKSMTTWLTF